MANGKRLATLIGIATTLAPIHASAAPHIADRAWRDHRGSHLEIHGSDFGSGPDVRLFDTFSHDTSGDDPLAIDSPNWFDRDRLDINADQAFSGGGSAIIVDTANDIRNKLKWRQAGSKTPHGTGVFQEVYFSYAVKDLGRFPGRGGTENSFPDPSSTKDAWLMLGPRGNEGGRSQWQGNDIVVPSYAGGNFLVIGNNTDLGEWSGQRELYDNWHFGGWNQMFFHAEVDPKQPKSSGSGFFGFANDKKFFITYRDGRFMTEDDPDQPVKKPYWDRVKFGPYYKIFDGATGINRIIDSTYVATGPNADARILIGDAKKLNQVTRLHHGMPVRWTDGTIVADFSHVDLTKRDDWYLFISNGDSGLPQTGVALPKAGAPPKPPKIEDVEALSAVSSD